MALINCPECQKKISDSSTNCIGCGFPLNQKIIKRVNPANNRRKSLFISLSIVILIAAGALFYQSGMITKSRDAYSLENIKVNEINQLFLDFQTALKNKESLVDIKVVYNEFPEFQELFKYCLKGAFNNEDEWVEFITKTPFASPNLVFSTISLSNKTLLKKRYDLFLSKKILTSKTSFQKFYSADEEQQTALFNLGKEANIFSTKYDLATFQEAWSETPQLVQDCINAYGEYYLNRELIKIYKSLVVEGIDLGSEIGFLNKIKDNREREVLLTIISNSNNNNAVKKICDLFNISFSNIPLDNLNILKNITNKKAFDSNGNFMGLVDENGLWTGQWKEYYSNNVLAIEGNYDKGLMNGKFKFYLRDGKLCHEGIFNKGLRNERNKFGYVSSGRKGIHKFYHSNGKLKCKKNVSSKDFKNCFVEYWYENGVKGGEIKFSSYDRETDKSYSWFDNYGEYHTRYTYKNSTRYFNYTVIKWKPNGLQKFKREIRGRIINFPKELVNEGFFNY